jgi:small-conductance mechanosensitive channel
MASLFGISHSFSFIFGNSLKEIWENLVYLFTIHAFDVGDIIILADTRYTIKTISLTHVGCTRVDNASFTIPMQSFVGQELNNITRSGCKWKGSVCSSI